MAKPLVDVLEDGAVRLGDNVVCDGFIDGCSVRIQTHVHQDHMRSFSTSKGRQDIFASVETCDLLIAEYDADLAYRSNLIAVSRGVGRTLVDGSVLRLFGSNHMLGACQVMLELPNGYRLGYSGDFGWPLDKVIEVDELVVDSTYGAPRSVRGYTQSEAERCLLEVVCEQLRYGSVHIQAHPGTIERVLQVLNGNIEVPILGSPRLVGEVQVYQNHGVAPGLVHPINSDFARAAVNERSYVRLYSRGDGFRNEQIEGARITCSAFMVNATSPMLAHSDRAYSIALSNHADFEETLRYVEATGAHTVIADNTRNYGVELSNALNELLPEVRSFPSTNEVNRL